ncbi:hypothetical protein [Lacinutrix sp. Bg11-31]|uniref:hypothetical protein n=1 Tax=Lacinutrix sp. Bg11-31 TaxID=2057808 RepID=UPI000C31A9BA|nr:hypothetical protein [Lacinutrix sp. Bg11-31]AUC82953.1 hypothetical protein CW733_12785 [Lacinutrix sp. Bg11-31]
MYSTKENNSYSKKNRLTQKIKRSNLEQDIQFEFPNGVRPYDLRIDFSDNKDQNGVVFRELKINDSLNNITINKNNFFANFKLSKDIVFKDETSVFKGVPFKTKEGKMGYNPYFMPNSFFRERLIKFNNANINKEQVLDTENGLNKKNSK